MAISGSNGGRHSTVGMTIPIESTPEAIAAGNRTQRQTDHEPVEKRPPCRSIAGERARAEEPEAGADP